MSLPDIGQFVVMQVLEGIFRGNYESRLQKMDKQSLYFDMPMNINTRSLQKFTIGTRLLVHYSDISNIPCAFETVVENDYLSTEQEPVFVVKMPDLKSIRKNQRREYVRVPFSIPGELIVMDTGNQRFFTFQGEIQDLSGGGLAIQIAGDQNVNVGDFVGIRFQLRQNNQVVHISSRAQVVRVQKSDFFSRKVCGLKFIDLQEQDRQNIIQFVFRRQIELRERGWFRSQ